ncbi:MAG TPA: AAA family ATPase, partial [Xanthomonadales bacterium]|nr:AAA family ATPase [Xanthomonadales bacterium]
MQRLLKVLDEGLIERQTPVRLALLSALAGEHMLLIGPHGTAKSVLARKLHRVFEGGHYFERLLTKFSVPEELFGPLSIRALEDDRYLRLTDRYLPSAHVAFIDEIFKANSAILNALLTLLNEKEFDNGDQRLPVPLVSVIGASNELPDEPELQALYDRFLCRYQVDSVSSAGFQALLELRDTPSDTPVADDLLNARDLAALNQAAEALPLSDEMVSLLQALREALQSKQQYISDRRWRKVVKWLKVSAYSNDQDCVTIWDGWLLQHCLWDDPSQRQELADWYQAHIGLGSGFNPERVEKLVSAWEQAHRNDHSSQTQQTNERGEPLFLDPQGKTTTTPDYIEWCERAG